MSDLDGSDVYSPVEIARRVEAVGEAKARIRAAVPTRSLKTLCAGCEWEPYGMCEAALARLHAERE